MWKFLNDLIPTNVFRYEWTIKMDTWLTIYGDSRSSIFDLMDFFFPKFPVLLRTDNPI